MKKLFSTILVVLIVAASVIAVGCGGQKFSYWKVDKEVCDDGDGGEDVIVKTLEVTLSDTDIAKIWFNISDLKVDEITVGYSFGTSGTVTNVNIKKSFLKNSDGWYSVSVSSSLKTLKITVSDTMRLNEIVFLNKKDKVMEFEFVKYSYRPSKSSSSKQEITKEKLESLNEKNSPLCAFDEQDLFDLEEAKALFDKATDLSKTEDDNSSSK